MEDLTHWKTLVPNKYTGTYEMPLDGSDVVVTIRDVQPEKVKGANGKEDDCVLLWFKEIEKPMIANRTNMKTITKIYQTPHVEKWKGKKIQLYVAQVKFGDTTEGLRIRDFIPVEKNMDVKAAKIILNESTSLADLQNKYLALSKPEQANAEVIKLKDQLKEKLK